MANPVPQDPGWSWFESVPGTPADPALADAYHHCFAGPAGQRVLAHLRALTLDRALGPEASPAALRHLEGQRALVFLMLRWAEYPLSSANSGALLR